MKCTKNLAYTIHKMPEETPLEKARQLVLSISAPQEIQPDLDQLEHLPKAALNMRLLNLYNTAADLAAKGETKRLSQMLRLFDFFSDHTHDEKLLSCVAQAEMNNGLAAEDKKNYDHAAIKDAITILTTAMKQAPPTSSPSNSS